MEDRPDKPPLVFLHDEQSLAAERLEYHRKRSTADIVESLMPGLDDSLKVRANGVIMDGNHRIWILVERGYDVNSLPRQAAEETEWPK